MTYRLPHPTPTPRNIKTTMFATLGRRTALHAARRTAQQQAKRRMGGGAAAAPEWTGIDKVVRGYFPKDEDSEFIFYWPFFIVRRLVERL